MTPAALRPRALAWQLAVLVTVETALYLGYARFDSVWHYAIHLLVAVTAVSIWQAAHLLVTGRPTRWQLLSLLGFHLWAMWPDIVFRTGTPHYRWMDWVALGHVRSHLLPGGDTAWLVIALTCAGAYALLLHRWLHAQHTRPDRAPAH